MKTLKLTILILTVGLMAWSCKKDKEEGSYVDDYVPTLTEEAGISYTGNYYPMEVGYTWNWSGTGSIKGEMTMDIMGTTPLDEDNVPLTGYMNVVGQEDLTLPSGTYTVLKTSETDGMTRYFEKKNDAVYIRAFKSADSDDIIEVENPVYLRNPLVVGDIWETNPQVDYNKMMEGYSNLTNPDVDVDMKCKFYVVGKENMTWDGSNRETLRLDQRAEVNGTMTSDEGTMKFNMKMTVYLNLVEDIGLIYQEQDLAMTMNGSFGAQGITLKMSMNADMDGDMTLDYYSLGTNGPEVKIANENGKVSVNNKDAQKQIDALMQIINVIKKTSF